MVVCKVYLSLNGELIEEKYIITSPLGEAFMYGYGLFETIKIENCEAKFLNEHINRLLKGCASLKLSIQWTLSDIMKFSSELIKKNNINNGALKIIYSKGINGNDLIIIWKNIIYNREFYEKGFKLCFCISKKNPYSSLVYLKTNNYLENLINRKQAQEKGYDEGVFLNVNDKISEGTFTNIFFVKNGVIYTPSLECGLLPGIIREKVINLANDLNIEIRIKGYSAQDLLKADEIFITNSLMEIMPVSSLENRIFALEGNSVTKILMSQFGGL
jgi:4-amino-4-deoxychorismate lyase